MAIAGPDTFVQAVPHASRQQIPFVAQDQQWAFVGQPWLMHTDGTLKTLANPRLYVHAPESVQSSRLHMTATMHLQELASRVQNNGIEH